MAKGIKIGVRVKVSFPKTGKTNKGTWQFFTANEVVKNQQTGGYDTIGRYTIWVNNPNPNIKHGDWVVIDKITKSVIEQNDYNGRIYNVNVLYCDCTLQAPYTPQFIDNQQQAQINYQTPSSMPDFNVSADDLPFD